MPEEDPNPNRTVATVELSACAREILALHLRATIDVHTMPAKVSAVLTGILTQIEEDPHKHVATTDRP